MSMRKHLIKKIIREELAAAAKQRKEQRKILSEGMRTPEPTRPAPAANRAIAPGKRRSDYTSIVDEPDSKPYFVEAADPREEEGTDELGDPLQRLDRPGRRPKEAIEMLDEDVVDIDDIDKKEDIPAVPGYPVPDDHEPSLKEALLSEAQIHRWKKLARINEQAARPELPELDLEGVPEAGEVGGIQDQADAAAEDLGDLEAAAGTEDPLANIDIADEPLPVTPPPDEMEAPEPEPEIDFEDMFAGEEDFEIEPDAEPLPGLEDLQAIMGEPMPGDGGGAVEELEDEDLGPPAHRDDDAAISLRIREEITRILKEKL